MVTMLRRIGRPLMTLAVLFAASLASQASACSTMKPGSGACDTVCVCCSPEANEAPTNRVEVAERLALHEAQAPCETSPGSGCSCRSQDPVAPTPKTARTTVEGRSDLRQGEDFVLLGDDAAARTKVGLRVPTTLSTPKIPLYLRNARLLF